MGTEDRTCVEVGKQTVAENPAELVIKSFLSCSISNALDGTENDAVYEEKTLVTHTRGVVMFPCAQALNNLFGRSLCLLSTWERKA